MKVYFLWGALFFSLLGCDNSSSTIKTTVNKEMAKPSNKVKDLVKITRIEPNNWSQYKAGEQVTLTTTLAYKLISSQSANMSLIIQGPNFKSIGQKDIEVSNQKESVTIAVNVIVPQEKTMSVFGALTLKGMDNSISADMRKIELHK